MAAARRPPSSATGEGPIAAPDMHGAQFPFGSVVRHAQAAIVEEAGERVPAPQAIVDRLAGIAVLGDARTLLAQPALQLDDERPAAFVADGDALLAVIPLMSRSIANSASIRLTASAAIGALLRRARSKNLCRACAQQAASIIGSDSFPMKFAGDLVVLQWGNQRHADRTSNFVPCAEWVGCRERK